MQHPGSLIDNETISEYSRSSIGTSSHENTSTFEMVESGHTDSPGKSSDTSNVSPKRSDGQADDETVLAGENDDFLGAHRPSPEPRWLRLCRGRGLWIWEIVGAMLSLSCIVSLLVLLPYLDESSLAKWQFVIAPNTIISTFITIAKTSTLLAVAAGISQLKWVHFTSTKRQISDIDIFDEASRGPWGAFNFILRMKGRSALTSVGAFVVLVSLAMEPFAQQILSFETRSVVSANDSAQVSIAHTYDDPVYGSIDQNYTNPEFREAFMMGILRSPFPWSFWCSTGNCSWSDFSTLAICASCTNVTSSSRKRVIIDQAVNTSNGEWGTNFESIYYTTPTGLELKVSPGGQISSNDSNGVRSSTKLFASLVTSTALEAYPSVRERQDPVLAVAAIASSFKPGERIVGDDVLPQWYRYDYAPPDITECSISWCAKKYQSLEVLNGAVVSTSQETLKLLSRDVGKTETYCSDYYKTFSTTARINEEESTNFTISCQNYDSMSNFVVQSLNFTLTQNEALHDDNVPSFIGSRLLAAPSVTALFEDIAESMTHHIQTGPNCTTHNGIASLSEIHVIVRWRWVIMPALIPVIGAFFLAGIIFVNHRSGLRLWKGSLKPLLFHGLDGWDLDHVDVDNVYEMEYRAKEMKAQLARNEEGRLKLVRG